MGGVRWGPVRSGCYLRPVQFLDHLTVIIIVIHSSTGVQQLGDGRGYHKRAFPEPWDCARMCVCHHTNPARKPAWIYHRAPMCRNHTGTLYHD